MVVTTHTPTLICRKFYQNTQCIWFFIYLPISPSIIAHFDSAFLDPVLQAWLFSDHLIQQQGKCLTATSTSISPGSLVILQVCNPREGRQVSLPSPGHRIAISPRGTGSRGGNPWEGSPRLKQIDSNKPCRVRICGGLSQYLGQVL